jgi:enterobacteria phage integrase
LRIYFRRKGCPSVPLPGDTESDEFREAYTRALLAVPKKQPVPVKPAAPGTIEALIRSYYQSPEFVGLRDTKKKSYRQIVETIRELHGRRVLAGMTRERIVTNILQAYADRPGLGLAILKTLRILICHA